MHINKLSKQKDCYGLIKHMDRCGKEEQKRRLDNIALSKMIEVFLERMEREGKFDKPRVNIKERIIHRAKDIGKTMKDIDFKDLQYVFKYRTDLLEIFLDDLWNFYFG